MTKQNNNTKVAISRRNQVTYEQRETLFGLVKWHKKISAVKIADDLIIVTDENIDKIYLNGKELIPKND